MEKDLRRKIVWLAVWVAVIFVALTAGTAVYFGSDTASAQEIVAMYAPKAQDMIDENGALSIIKLLLSNIFACAMCVGLGFIPFIFLPALSVISNAALIGALLGLGAASGIMPVAKTIAFGLLPHGIFELPAFFLSMAMGIYLCKLLSRKILGRAKEERVLPILNGLAKTFVLGAIPLLIVAALIECYITPALMTWAGLS